MARTVAALGSVSPSIQNSVRWISPSGVLIDPGLVADGGVAYLRFFTIPRAPFLTHVELDTNATDSGSGGGAGPELSAKWESSESAIGIHVGGLSIVIPGPTAPGSSDDPTEPYIWTPPNVSEVRAFANSVAGLSAQQRNSAIITLQDFGDKNLYFGSRRVRRLYYGQTEIERIYRGTVEVG